MTTNLASIDTYSSIVSARIFLKIMQFWTDDWNNRSGRTLCRLSRLHAGASGMADMQ